MPENRQPLQGWSGAREVSGIEGCQMQGGWSVLVQMPEEAAQEPIVQQSIRVS